MRFFNHRRHGHVIGSVYLVHFARSYNGAQHYLGFSTNIPQRVKAHRSGRGAPLLAAVTKRGITWRVVRTWQKKDGFFEQHLKRGYTPTRPQRRYGALRTSYCTATPRRRLKMWKPRSARPSILSSMWNASQAGA